jgi:sialidase-1
MAALASVLQRSSRGAGNALLLVGAWLLATTSATTAAAHRIAHAPHVSPPPWVDVFTRGEGGYFCIKIPSLTVTPSGALLATGEGRLDSCSDYATTHLVYKRSTDGGATWSPLATLYGEANGTVIGNAAPVVVGGTARILVVFCRDNLDVLATSSADDGLTWTLPTLLTGVTNASWTWVGTGPPAGLQLTTGRIVIPSYHSSTAGDDGELSSGHVMFSDDGGDTWTLGDTFVDDLNFPNECQAVELPDGSLFVNSRGLLTARVGALSSDGGQTWQAVAPITGGLEQPLGGCEGSTLLLPDGVTLVYSGLDEESVFRYNLTLWTAAAADAATGPWTQLAVVNAGPSGYSALAAVPGPNATAVGTLGLLFEREQRDKHYLSA